MFDFRHTSPNGRYTIDHQGDFLVLKSGPRVVWKRPCPQQEQVSVQASDRGQVCLRREGQALFLDARGAELARVGEISWGWFSAEGSRYFAYRSGTDGLQQLKFGPGARYQPVDDATLPEALAAGVPSANVLCELAGRGLKLPVPRKAEDSALYGSEQNYWKLARTASVEELERTLPIFLKARGLANRRAMAQQLESLSEEQLECVLNTLHREPPPSLGPLSPPLRRLAARHSSAVAILLKVEGLEAALAYLPTPQGQMVVLPQLLTQRQPASVPILLQLLQANPRHDWVLQALRFQCRVGLDADPVGWRAWCSSPTHSLEERLQAQSRHRLPGFLLASWNGHLTRADFAYTPRLVRIAQPEFPSLQALPVDPGGWSYRCLTPDRKNSLASRSPGQICLLDPKGERLTPDRFVAMPGKVSFSGRYLQIHSRPQVEVLEMITGRTLRLPESGPRSLAFSSAEDEVAVAGPDSLRTYSLPEGRLLREVPFARVPQMEGTSSALRVQDSQHEYVYQTDALPTRAALQPQNQRLLAELWTGHRLQGGLAVRLTAAQWNARRLRWEGLFGPLPPG